jgi:hypothetical protein
MSAEVITVPRFGSLPGFVGWLSVHYARQVTDTHMAVWCPYWWEHPEVRERLDTLWGLYEVRRLDGPEGMSTWWLDADLHMRAILDPGGAMKYCSARHGHKTLLQPLPLAFPPEGMFEIVEPVSLFDQDPAAALGVGGLRGDDAGQ